MKLKKFIGTLIITIIFILTIAQVKIYSADQSYILGATNIREDKGAYQISPNGQAKKVWKIVSYPSMESSTPNYANRFYCLKADLGFSANNNTSLSGSKKIYNTKLNMKTQKDEVLTRLNAVNVFNNSQATYNKLLWIIDHMYLPGTLGAEQTKTQLLENAEIIGENGYEEGSLLTDSDIEAVQQLVIWYFTNPNDANYNSTQLPALFFNNNSGRDENYDSLANLYDDSFENVYTGTIRQEQAGYLYEYLINGANENSNYTPQDQTSPISLQTGNFKAVQEGERYIIGPLNITIQPDRQYDITQLKFKDENGTQITLTGENKLLNQNKQVVTSGNIQDVIGQDFYISLPITTNIKQVNFSLNGSFNKTEATYYTTSEATYLQEQPVVLVEKLTQPIIGGAQVSIPEPKELDLALRKSITKINGQAPAINRLPQVDISKLQAGTSTTATYNHPKNDLETTTGSFIEYTINVCNEGEKDAYAAEIKDYLPAGIEFVELVSPKDKYAVTEEKHQDGTSTLTITNTGKTVLNKFSNGNLAHEAFTIRCKITLDPEKENVRLVNIAEITKYFDAESNIEKNTDRDSQIENFPDNKKNNTYTGNGKEGDYIPGQQDDDDFEPIVVVKKELDLALRKSITKINDQAPTINRLPQVDISKLEAGTSTTATYNHPKNDLETTTGSIIEYTLNVFNEGQRDAYAAEIKDYLPAGIEFVELVSPQDKYKAVATKNSNGTTTVTITNTGKTVLNKFSNGNLDYEGLTIRCRITAKASTTDTRLVNIAEITKYFDAQSNIEKDVDRDSQIQNFPSDKKNNSYIGNGKEGDYIPGQQDDDDFEPIVIPKAYFDLSLRKFISEVNDIPPKTNREPVVDISKLQAGTSTTAIYNHTKVPLTVRVGDIVTYTIRVYNEGQIDGYASQITDHLPEYLEFLPEDEENIANGWMYDENDSTLRTIKTNHLSKEVDIDNILKAFDGTTLSYKDVKVKCRIKNTAISNQDITNIADITEYTDEAGNKVPDRDSNEENVELPPDEELPNYKDEEINKGDKYIPGQEDDDDFEKVNIQVFDLALRKFITKVDNKDVTNRIPNLSIDEKGNIKYTHTKEPVLVQTNNIVTYTLRIFNEGDTDGYAKEITDNLPQGLQFLPEHETNKNYRWIMIDKEGNKTTDITKATKITTDYLSKEQEKEEGQNLIKAYNKEAGITQDNPDYKDVKVAFKVVEPNTSDRILTNTAEISEDSDKEGKPVDDIDSTPDNNEPNEDDIDEEHVKLIYFDLALRKFITKVNNLDINNRVPNLSLDEKGNIKYTHTKEPVQVEQKDIVTYTLRIYNEGKIDGYAKEVTDNIPEGLEFLPEHETNQNYRWIMIDKEGNKTTDITKATKITTDYLSKEQEKEEGQNLIKAFDKKAGITDKNPDYKDVKVAFRVIEPNTSDRIIINTAEISKDSDKEGKPVDDVDSTPGNEEPNEDDIDIEKVKVKYFDLALKKWVSNVIIIEDGKQTTTNTGHTGDENPEPVVKVDLKSKQLNKVTVKFGYKIKVTNEGQIEGYAKEVKDYIPDGLKFVQEDNPKWAMINEKEVVTQQLQNTLLKPGESATVDILLTWENSENNLGQKVNIAEISQHYNDSDTPDIDSTPNNKKPGEDDIDDAPVLLSVKTGQARLYIVLTTTILLITAVGVILIKKYII